MARYKFVNDREAMIPDLKGAILQPDQIFDPEEFGLPDWAPEPNPHPLFQAVDDAPKPVVITIPVPAQEPARE